MADKSHVQDELRNKLHDAIQRIYSEVDPEYEGAMLMRFVLMPEFMDRDGDRSLFATVSPDCRMWEALGMVHHFLNTIQGQLLADEVKED